MPNLSVTIGFVPGPAVEADPEQWARVAEYVQARRLELGLSQDEVGASRSVASNLESRRQVKYTRASLWKIATALGWTKDSIERILAGSEPEDAPSGDDEEDLRAIVADLRRRLADVERRLAAEATEPPATPEPQGRSA